MTDLLNKAFEQASKLSPEEQDAIASLLLAELAAERDWAHRFDATRDELGKLSREALGEHERGETEDLDPSQL